MRVAHLATACFLMLPATAWAQTIQRCEGDNQRITYSNAECPVGSRAVKAVPPAPRPSAEDRAAAQARQQSVSVPTKAQPKQQRPQAAADNAIQRAADCGYLQASIDSSRRLRNVLTTRPYYSTEDVDEADARTNELAAEYRRVCG